MALRHILAKNVRNRRNAMGWSQEDLAEAANLNRTSISSIETSKFATTIDTIERLAGALQSPAWELLRKTSRN